MTHPFNPDLTPEQMDALGVLSGIYNDKDPKTGNFFGVEASMKQWKEKWLHESAPMGWYEWYQGYASGKRGPDDERQIRRWYLFKARHLAQLQKADPELTHLDIQPRRRQALLNWGIAPGINVDRALETGSVNKYLEKSAGGYREPGSTFTHDGVEYDLNGVLLESDSIPVHQYSVDKLKWILEGATGNVNRVRSADISTPILVHKLRGKLVAVDGFHRVSKAVENGVKSLPGRLITDDILKSNVYLEKAASMQRAKYHAEVEKMEGVPHRIASIKYDGANYFLKYSNSGEPTFISRKLSVKGQPIIKTDRVPHLAKVLPSQAGKVYNVELIHTGHDPKAKENHARVSGLLNALPPRSISEQERDGPIRAVIFDVIDPKLNTYEEKIKHMAALQKDFGNTDLMFHPEFHVGEEAVKQLVYKTRKEGREGVIMVDPTRHEASNPRVKLKHKNHYNLKVSKILQEVDIHGNPKPSAGALRLEDRTGRDVGKVGTGFDHETRKEIWANPNKWLGKLIQVEAMPPTASKLRSAVYNGDADGGLDKV